MCTTSIRIVTTDDDLRSVFRFRYDVYVSEMGRSSKHADHSTKQLQHPLDSTAVNIAAFDGSEIVGVIRNNIGQDGSFGCFRDFYGIDASVHDHPTRTSITSGLMIASSRRSGNIGPRLAIATYEYGLSRGLRWNFIDCIPSLAPYFYAMGWVEHLPDAMHPEYSFSVKRLRLNLEDEEHLERVHSPFLPVYRKHKRQQHTILHRQ